jgi:transcriptional regulator with XRE-family HTH domain
LSIIKFVINDLFFGGVILVAHIIDRIVSLMKSKGLSNAQLASAISVPNNTISEWKSGRIKPNIVMIVEMSELFDVSTDYILKGVSSTEEYNASHINNSAVAQGDNAKAINGTPTQSDEVNELLRIFSSLDVRKRHELLSFAFTLEE